MVKALEVSVFVSVFDGEAFALVKTRESFEAGAPTVSQFAPVSQSALPADPCQVFVAAEAGKAVNKTPERAMAIFRYFGEGMRVWDTAFMGF